MQNTCGVSRPAAQVLNTAEHQDGSTCLPLAEQAGFFLGGVAAVLDGKPEIGGAPPSALTGSGEMTRQEIWSFWRSVSAYNRPQRMKLLLTACSTGRPLPAARFPELQPNGTRRVLGTRIANPHLLARPSAQSAVRRVVPSGRFAQQAAGWTVQSLRNLMIIGFPVILSCQIA